MAVKIKGFRALINKVVRENDSQSAAVNQAFDAIPDSQLKGNKAEVRNAIKEKFEAEGPKAGARKGQTKALERKASESQARETDAPQTEALVKLGDVMRAKPKRDLDPTKTKEEAGRSAERVALSMTSKQRQRLQSSYNGKKAQVAWLKENDPKSPMIADLQKEMANMRKRASIDTGVSVTPKKPAGASTSSQRTSAAAKSKEYESSKEGRLAKIKQVQQDMRNRGIETDLNRIDDKKNMARGGKATKKAIGNTDYRMNKGGLLLSSVDNRKKK